MKVIDPRGDKGLRVLKQRDSCQLKPLREPTMPKPPIRYRLRRRPGPRLKIDHFGPIQSADVEFGNLTVLVGPQATGKSIFLQLLKLLVDVKQVKYELKRAGIDWQGKFEQFLDVYFGEGMRSLHSEETSLSFQGKEIQLPDFVSGAKSAKSEALFFIPAQRVLALREGWPQAFTYYDPGVPFAVREFSEALRLLMTNLKNEQLFPIPKRLKQEFRELIGQHFFPGFDLQIDAERAQKRLVLSSGESEGSRLPYMVWSAGQREFVPLLLGLYHLMPPTATPRRKGVQWAVIEELEMGLHPRATAVAMLMVFELVARGYRVCVSTHSPQVLDAIWALKHLRENGADPKALLGVFDAPAKPNMIKMAESVLAKTVKVYYFDRETGTAKDISALDPESEEMGEEGWGGLTEFSGRANAAVARAVANRNRGGDS